MKKIIQKISAHCCIVCSLALFAIRVLDWYNPFMDFAGHSGVVTAALAISAFLLGMMRGWR